jgi:hypothetical protein
VEVKRWSIVAKGYETSFLWRASGEGAVVWADSRGEPGFLLQSRGVSLEDEAKLRARSGGKLFDVDVTINLSAQLGIRYCPFCGRRLEELLHENREFFQKLAQEHEKFVTVDWEVVRGTRVTRRSPRPRLAVRPDADLGEMVTARWASRLQDTTCYPGLRGCAASPGLSSFGPDGASGGNHRATSEPALVLV